MHHVAHEPLPLLLRLPPRAAHAATVVAVAALYLLAGKLALLLAIPPGYATAVWPAAGIAVALALLAVERGPALRNAAIAGVALGSFAVNAGTGIPTAGAASADVRVVAVSLAIAAVIACGAAAQAAVATVLVRRFVRAPTTLELQPDVLLFCALAGPVACLLSASTGIATLVVAGRIPSQDALFSWFTWWVGDTIGVLLFAPLFLIVAKWRTSDLWRRRRILGGAPLVLGFVAVTALFLCVSDWAATRKQDELERIAAPVASHLDAKLGQYAAMVTEAASFFDASDVVRADEFATFTARALATHPEIRAFGWDQIVDDDDREAFEADAGFPIRERSAAAAAAASSRELVVAAQRASYVPVRYIEPPGANNVILGFDAATDPQRRAAIDSAIRTGGVALSEPIDLIQGKRGIALFSPALRNEHMRGLAAVALATDDLVAAPLTELRLRGLALEIVDVTAPEHPLLVTEAPASASAAFFVRTVNVGGRTWRIAISEDRALLPATTTRAWEAWLVLAAGLTFVAMLGMLMLISTGAAAIAARAENASRALNADLERRVADRTMELAARVEEREVLLKEVHHRVKNNLQLIMSLMNLQMREINEARTSGRAALAECRSRVQTIGLIHEALYQSDDHARVTFSDYAATLVRNVGDVAGAGARVRVSFDLDPVVLAVDKAIPCGLVLNELVTNCFKHAFPAQREGLLTVSLKKTGENEICMSVEDDGVGLRADVASSSSSSSSSSLGMVLVRTLTKQLRGSFTVEAARTDGAAAAIGTRSTLRFVVVEDGESKEQQQHARS